MGGLGDCLLTFPLLEILTNKGHEVTVWGRTDYFQLALMANFCSKISFFKPTKQFDLEIRFTSEIPSNSSDNVIRLRPWITEQIWFVDYYLKELGLYGESYSMDLSSRLCLYPVKKRQDLCLIHPGSGSRKKNADIILYKMIEDFMRKEGYEVRYILGPCEMELRDIITDYNFFSDIVELTRYLVSAGVYIGMDSGVSHLSAYLGINSYIFYGPSDPVIWHPIGDSYRIIRLSHCKPCFPNVCEDKSCLNAENLFEQFKKVFLN